MDSDRHEAATVAGTREATGRRRPTPEAVIEFSLIALFVLARITIIARSTPLVAIDTTSYGPRPGITFNTLSFLGDAPRPWGVPLLYSIIHDDYGRAVAQSLIGTLAWSVLAYALMRSLSYPVARVLAVGGLLAFALTPVVYTWDFALLSESLSVNLAILAFALFALWLRTGSRVAFGGMLTAAFWWIFIRPDMLPFVGLLVLCAAIVAWRRRDRRLTALVMVGVLLAGVGWQVATLPRIDAGYAKWAPLPLSEMTFLYRLRLTILPDPAEKSVYVTQFGMPDCPAIDEIARHSAWNITGVVHGYQNCPDLQTWVRDNGQSSGYRYLAAAPGHFLAVTEKILPWMLGNDRTYVKPVRVLPAAVTRIYIPSDRTWSLPIAGLVALLSLAVVLAAGGWRRRSWLMAAALALGVGAVLNSVLQQMYSVGEYVRFGLQESILLRVALVVLVVCAVDAVAARLRRRPDPADVREPLIVDAVEPEPAVG